ncbi:MAG: TRAP transporter substrate-binding protein DctP [Betaproteobacteria bacterium]|nr:TRAP transporter substrate-binding protein DctP [Betaproteobacteria bacterium]
MKRPSLATVFTFVFALFWAVVPVCSNAADPIKWKMPTAYPAGSYLWDFIAVNFANKVKSLSNGQLIIEPFTAGSIAPALKVTESVKNKVAEAGHTWTNYEMGSDVTSVLFGGIPGGLSDEQYFAWFYEGNGSKLLSEWRKEKLGLHSMVLGLGPQEIIHSHKPIRSLQDFKGLKMRTAGVWAELMPKLGASAVILPASDVYSALEKKIVDAIEWADPGTNFPLGFHQVAKYIIVPGVHQPAWPWEFVVNQQEWDKLPANLKTVVQITAKETTYEAWTRFVDKSLKAMTEYQKTGNEIIVLQDAVLKEVDQISAKWYQEQSAKNAWFKKVYEDQVAFKANWEKARYIRQR